MAASRRRCRVIVCNIYIFWCLFFIFWTKAEDDEWDEHLLCRQCGHAVAKASDFIWVSTSHAKGQRNDTILGRGNVLIQLLQNPQGKNFEVITTSKADVVEHKQVYESHTWFDGYGWKIVTCPHCRSHLGWYYEPIKQNAQKTTQPNQASEEEEEEEDTGEEEKQPFYGLILSYLIHQQYADSLVMTPKIYGS